MDVDCSASFLEDEHSSSPEGLFFLLSLFIFLARKSKTNTWLEAGSAVSVLL